MCLGYVRYSVRVSCHPCYLGSLRVHLTFLCSYFCVWSTHYSCFLFLIQSSLLILFPMSLPISSKSCICIFHLSMSVGLFWFDFGFVSSCVLFMFGLSVVFIVNLTFWFWPYARVLADNSLAFCLCTSIYLITWIPTSACLITISALPN